VALANSDTELDLDPSRPVWVQRKCPFKCHQLTVRRCINKHRRSVGGAPFALRARSELHAEHLNSMAEWSAFSRRKNRLDVRIKTAIGLVPAAWVQNGCSTSRTGKLAMSTLESRAVTSILAIPGAVPAGGPLPLAQTEPATGIAAITATASVRVRRELLCEWS
jgi:hypothetical protein